VSLDTTNIYAEIDLETKSKALAKYEVGEAPKPKSRWRENPELMAFLRSLQPSIHVASRFIGSLIQRACSLDAT
jgi:hypothetical protein